MDEQALRSMMIDMAALREGHYLRGSGRHSDHFVQCAALFRSVATGQLVAQALAARCRGYGGQLVLGAALGGILPGYEVARALQLPFIYCERQDGAMTLRRGFHIQPGTRVLIIEDEVQTGTSIRELGEIVRALGGQVVGIGCIVDKSGGRLQLDKPFEALMSLKVENYPAKACPLCQAGIPLNQA